MSSKRYPEEFKIEAVKQVTEKGHSVAEVAARAGIGVNTVSNLEAGRNVSFENLVRINYQLSRIIYCINLIPSTFEIQSVITRPTAQVQNLYLCREILKKWFVQTLHVNSVWALLHKYVSI